jgi:hypothetical protein
LNTPLFPCPSLGTFETLLLEKSVLQERDTFCGAACLQMLLRLEDSGYQGQQAEIAREAFRIKSPDDRKSSEWTISPFGMQEIINRHTTVSELADPDKIRWRYHVVHAAEAWGPLCEAVARLKGETISKKICREASVLLMDGGTHWALVAGAKVENGVIVWIALADPWQRELRFLTGPGLTEEFNASLKGEHPDWENRRIAVISTRLPRPKGNSLAAAGAPATRSSRPAPPLPSSRVGRLPEFSANGHSPALSRENKDRVLSALRDIAASCNTTGTNGASGAGALLHRLKEAHDTGHVRAFTAPWSRIGIPRSWLLQICDADGTPIAHARLLGDPPELAEFFMLHEEESAKGHLSPWETKPIIDHENAHEGITTLICRHS